MRKTRKTRILGVPSVDLVEDELLGRGELMVVGLSFLLFTQYRSLEILVMSSSSSPEQHRAHVLNNCLWNL